MRPHDKAPAISEGLADKLSVNTVTRAAVERVLATWPEGTKEIEEIGHPLLTGRFDLSDTSPPPEGGSDDQTPPSSTADAGWPGDATTTPRLLVRDLIEIIDDVQTRGPREWLIEGLWPCDAYGVWGATKKAGKTFAVDDLAVSVANGGKWLGRFPCRFGNVLLYLGEGGEYSTRDRFLAVAESKGYGLEGLMGIRAGLAVPHLAQDADLNAVRAEVAEFDPVLIVVDPAYLAMRGAESSKLFAMGGVLEGIQRIAQDHGAALILVWHWNQTGVGSGADRFTGAGPAEWGRILASAAVEDSRTEDGGKSNVLLRWEFTGEIADTTFRMRRRVWRDDPLDLESPMHYEVAVTDEGERPKGERVTLSRILAVLPSAPPGLLVREIGDALAKDGKGPPLKRPTIHLAVDDLASLGKVDADKPGNGLPNRWWGVGT